MACLVGGAGTAAPAGSCRSTFALTIGAMSSIHINSCYIIKCCRVSPKTNQPCYRRRRPACTAAKSAHASLCLRQSPFWQALLQYQADLRARG